MIADVAPRMPGRLVPVDRRWTRSVTGVARKSADEVLRDRGCLRRSYEVSAIGRELLLQLASLSRGGAEGALPPFAEVVSQLGTIADGMQRASGVDGSILRANLWYGPDCIALAKAIAAESRRMPDEAPSAILRAALAEVRYVPGPARRTDGEPDRCALPVFKPIVVEALASFPTPLPGDTVRPEGLHHLSTGLGDGSASFSMVYPPAIEPAIMVEGVAPQGRGGLAPHGHGATPNSTGADTLAANDPDLSITQDAPRVGPAGLSPAQTRSPDLLAMEAALYGGMDGKPVARTVLGGPGDLGPEATGVVMAQDLSGSDLRAVRPEARERPDEPPSRPPIVILADWVRMRLKRPVHGSDEPVRRASPLSKRMLLALVVALAGFGAIAAAMMGGSSAPSVPAAQAEASVPPSGQVPDAQQQSRVIDMLGPAADGSPASGALDASGPEEGAGPAAEPGPATVEPDMGGLRPASHTQPDEITNGGVSATGRQDGQDHDAGALGPPPASAEMSAVRVPDNGQHPAPLEGTGPSFDQKLGPATASVEPPLPDAGRNSGQPPPKEAATTVGPDPGQLAALVAELKQLRTEVKELKEVRRSEPATVAPRMDSPVANPKRGLGVDGRAAIGGIQRDASGAAYVSIIHGERLIDLAQRTGVPVAQLKAWNPALAAVGPQFPLARGSVWISAPRSFNQGRGAP